MRSTKVKGNLGYYWHILNQNKLTIASLYTFIILTLVGVFAPWISPYNPYVTSPSETLLPPSLEHLFGTDSKGRDIFTRSIYATRLDIPFAIICVLSSFMIALPIGSISGYWGGKLDEVIMRIMDIFLAFPNFILAIGIMSVMGTGLVNLYITQVLIRIPIFARIQRAQVLSEKENEYVEAAKCVGNSRFRILFRHILPNSVPPLLIALTYNFGYAILNIATLSFLGLGINPPTPEWGLLVSEGAPYITTNQWWLSFFPGLFIIISVLSFNMAGDGLCDIMDPRRKRV